MTLAIGHTGDEVSPDLRLHHASSSACGGRSDGVLGCATSTGELAIIDGWDWYTGVDPGGIGLDQYDFQTAVTHELLHTLGFEHSADPGSVLYAALAPGVARRSLTAGDLALPGTDDGALQPGIRPVREMGREDAPTLVVVVDEVLAPTYPSPAAEPVLDDHREVTGLARDSGETQTSFAQAAPQTPFAPAAPLARVDDNVVYDPRDPALISGLDASWETSLTPELLTNLASTER